MSQPNHRAEQRQYEADYYAQTQQKLQQGNSHFGAEDRPDVDQGTKAQTEKSAADYSVSQGDHLLQGQTTRGDAPAPEDNYPSKPHQELYNMVHTGLDTGDIDARGRVSNEFANWLAGVSNDFTDAAGASDSLWQGSAAGNANNYFQNTAGHAEQTGSALQLTSNRYSQQSAAAHYAKTNMPEPTHFDQNAEMDKAVKQFAAGDLVSSTNTMNAISGKQQKADADHQQAVQIMQGLDNTYHGTATTQPTYNPPQQPGQHNDSTSASSFNPGSVSGTTGGPGSGMPGGSGFTPTPGTQAGVPGALQPGAGGQPPTYGGGGSGTYLPPGSSTSGGTPGLGGGATRMPGGNLGGGMPRLGPDGMAISGGGGVGGAGGDTVRGGRSGPGGGGRGFAGSRVSGGGYTSGKTGGAESEPGKGSGSGSGKSAGERIARGGVAAANAKGAGGAGAAGAGAGKKKEEDKEHKNKTPTQEDPDEVFEARPEYGADGQKATTPVIGA
ncbi:hypothetical protein [Amycolatopsis sp. H20-H5]|uniref:hypothetical protein n=1 Tax=Amycolatopsis sp. H20-H5 TaxID=3046309 RepID=UPI002DB62607|nr:hypothetical protein [Amycolatopsis sp. H20-H5]MEC3978579.1 hypothetical protein [Amycolatopsis sp. H20-H5]